MSLRPDALQQILVDSANNGVYQLPSSAFEAVQDAAAAEGLIFYAADLLDANTGDAVLDCLARALKLPEHFGNNFDALYDCLTDLTWQHTSASVIVLTGAESLYTGDADAWEVLLSVFASAAEYWQEEETPFWVFIDLQTEGLAPLPTFA
jgi:RNAse (barnase) inhibitor barstar